MTNIANWKIPTIMEFSSLGKSSISIRAIYTMATKYSSIQCPTVSSDIPSSQVSHYR